MASKQSFGRVKAQHSGSFKKIKAPEKAPNMQRDYALNDKREFIDGVAAARKGERIAYLKAYIFALITGANRVAVK